MKILVLERPFSRVFYRRVVSEVFNNPEIIGISEWKKCSEIWVGSYVYDERFDVSSDSLDPLLMNDIISRDRTLRDMDRMRAERQVRRYWNGLNSLMARERFDFIFSLPIDCFLMDVLYRVAEIRRIPVLSFVGSFISGYARITLRGEFNDLQRMVADEEVDSVLSCLLEKRFLPESERSHVNLDHRHIKKAWAKRRLSEHIKWPLIRLLSGDPDNNHMNIRSIGSLRLHDLYDKNYENRFKHIDDLSIDASKTVYFPLHFIPEATTDYWCDSISCMGYEAYVTKTIEQADKEINFIVKEHPAMYGRRKLSFYDKLNSFDCVEILHPFDSSNELLDCVENVVVNTGTVGVESALRGKRVLTLSKNYYSDLHPNITLCDRVRLEDISRPLSDFDNREFLTSLLRGHFISDYLNDFDQSKCNAKEVADGIRLYFRSKGYPIEM